MKFIIIGGLPESLINFRGDLIKSIVGQGHEVIAMASEDASDAVVEKIEELGCTFHGFAIKRNGLNPIEDFNTLIYLVKFFRKEKPEVILSYTIKPVIWGGIAARISSKAKFFGLITGLGFAFQKGSLKRNILCTIVTKLYRFALNKSSGVIFQNPDNLNIFIGNGIIEKQKSYHVHGSGVNLEFFQRSELIEKPTTFLTIARLLGEKGLREYAQAAEIVKKQYPDTVFELIGPKDPSPDGIPMSEINLWQEKGYLKYLGATKDVRTFLAQCHIYVLASYHEGMPRTVLEAMATGRPILTTNVPGCKETVLEGENGFLVPKACAKMLAKKMIWFIENKEQWEDMANASYRLAQEKYDVNKVNGNLLSIMNLEGN